MWRGKPVDLRCEDRVVLLANRYFLLGFMQGDSCAS
jgi:hypothetical protein